MINQQTHDILDRFSQIPFFAKYKAILIGGTALSYHCSHRISYDLDICFPFSDTLPKLDFLEAFEEVIPLEFDKYVIDSVINEGEDIENLMQRYIIDGIKVDFVINPSSNIYEDKILQNNPAIPYGTLRIASLESIFELKSLLLLDRNKIRDLYDVVYLIKHHGFKVKDIIDTIIKYRITYQPTEIIRLIEEKVADPLDVEGIVEPAMDLCEYNALQDFLHKEFSTLYY